MEALSVPWERHAIAPRRPALPLNACRAGKAERTRTAATAATVVPLDPTFPFPPSPRYTKAAASLHAAVRASRGAPTYLRTVRLERISRL